MAVLLRNDCLVAMKSRVPSSGKSEMCGTQTYGAHQVQMVARGKPSFGVANLLPFLSAMMANDAKIDNSMVSWQEKLILWKKTPKH